MSKLEKYMNDPDIIKEPMPLREVHAIRLMIYDETKELLHFFHAIAPIFIQGVIIPQTPPLKDSF